MKIYMEKVKENGPFWDRINALALEAFPSEEYLAPEKLVRMAEEEAFDFWVLTAEGDFVGFMAVQLYKSMAYLFFLAIDAACRNRGYGALALEALQKAYPGKQQVVDFEMPDENAPNALQRQRRRQFYLRGGYKETGLFLSYLGVEYEVFATKAPFDEDLFKEMMGTLRVEGFHPRYFRK